MKTQLSVKPTIITALTLLMGTAAYAAPPFEVMDVDKDGFVSLEESAKLKSLPKVFKYMDKNENGKLEPVEYNYLRIGGEDNRTLEDLKRERAAQQAQVPQK